MTVGLHSCIFALITLPFVLIGNLIKGPFMLIPSIIKGAVKGIVWGLISIAIIVFLVMFLKFQIEKLEETDKTSSTQSPVVEQTNATNELLSSEVNTSAPVSEQ